MAVIHVPSSAVAPGAADVPGSGTGGATYVKAGSGILGRSATGLKSYGHSYAKTGNGQLVHAASGSKTSGPWTRVRWIGDQYDTAAIIVQHALRGAVITHVLRGAVTTHQTRALITTHRLRGEDA